MSVKVKPILDFLSLPCDQLFSYFRTLLNDTNPVGSVSDMLAAIFTITTDVVIGSPMTTTAFEHTLTH